MSELANQGSGTTEQARAYTAAILGALGDREPFEVLRETPAALRRAVAGVPPKLLSAPEKAGKWSMLEIVFHLADTEIVGSWRFRLILAHDRPAIQSYDQDLWAEQLRYAEGDPETALAQFSALRHANLELLERTTPEERQRFGVHAERGEESVGHMIRMYAGHDLVHLRQIARVRRAVSTAAGR